MQSPPIGDALSATRIRRSDLTALMMFFPVSILDQNPLLLVDILAQSAEGVFKESDEFFRLRINPDRLEVTKSKITSLTYTKAGHQRSYFGNEVAKFEYSGTTGYFRPPNFIEQGLAIRQITSTLTQDGGARARDEIARKILSGSVNITQSPVWQKFMRFDRFIDRMQGDVVLYFDLMIMKGAVTRFTYRRDANDPLQIRYALSFEALPDTRIGEDRFGKGMHNFGLL